MASVRDDSDVTVAKTPRTDRGRRTHRAILDAAALEFGERGFQGAAISRITARAGVALGSFYTYFDSKEAVFQALVGDLTARVADAVRPHVEAAPDGLAGEGAGLAAFLGFVREHKEIYRIIDEAEFVDPDSYRRHYTSTVERIAGRLRAAGARGEVSPKRLPKLGLVKTVVCESFDLGPQLSPLPRARHHTRRQHGAVCVCVCVCLMGLRASEINSLLHTVALLSRTGGGFAV